MTNKERFYEIDALRGIAAFSVCLFHFGEFRLGCVGVDLFFVISGFVIFLSINSSHNLRNFWLSRIIRLYPTYWLSIVLAIFCSYLLNYPIPNYSITNIIGNLTMLQPIFRAENFSGVFWTLYVELLFYLAISLIWIINKFKNIESIIIVSLVLTAIINGLHLTVLKEDVGFTRFFVITRFLVPLISHIQFFFAGIIFYLIYYQSININRIFILIFTLVSTSLSHKDSVMINSFLNMPEHVFSCVIIYLFVIGAVFLEIRVLRNKILLFIGFISYPLYLVHDTFGLSLYKFLLPFVGSNFSKLLGIVSSFFLACLITYLFDVPLRSQLKKNIERFLPEKKRV
jgi:peptidoglycan/LPS O-acetylase OafA/YrhL